MNGGIENLKLRESGAGRCRKNVGPAGTPSLVSGPESVPHKHGGQGHGERPVRSHKVRRRILSVTAPLRLSFMGSGSENSSQVQPTPAGNAVKKVAALAWADTVRLAKIDSRFF
jgi:hypothetical protein